MIIYFFTNRSIKGYPSLRRMSNTPEPAPNSGLEVIAEGVETEEELCLLQAQNCNLYQGYYFSKPVPADAFEKLLQIQFTGIPPYQSSANLDRTIAFNI